MRNISPLLFLFACQSETQIDPAPEELPHLVLTIDAPAAASWHNTDQVDVSGTFQNLASIEVVGADQTTTGDGTYSATRPVARGLELVQVVGRGEDGTEYRAHNGVMVGPTADPDVPVPDAMRMRINNPGLTLLLDTVEDQLTGAQLEPLLLAANPVYDTVDGDLSVKVDLTEFGLSQTELRLTPADGDATLMIRLWDLKIGVHIDARKGAFSATPSQVITADKVELTGKLAIDVVDGKLKVSLTDSDVQISNFGFDDSKWPSWLSGAFTDAIFRELLEGALRTLLNDTVPALVDDKLAELELSFDTTMLDRTVSIAAEPNTATFDPNGLLIGTHMDVNVSGALPVDAPGYLSSAPAIADIDVWSDMSLGLSDDLLNRITFEAWRAGLLSYELSTEKGNLPAYVLDLLGGSRTGSMKVRADLPPAIVQSEGLLRAQIGELRVVVQTPGGAYGDLVDLAVGGSIDLNTQVREGTLQLTFGDKVVQMVVRETDWGSDIPRVTEQVSGLLPLEAALNILQDMQIPLPAMAGITIQNARVERDKSTTHTNITIDLKATP